MTVLQGLIESPGTWTVAPARSTVRFTNKTLWGLVPVNGEFTDVSGHGEIAANGAVSGRIDIRVASLKTGIGKRDEHLRADDFFAAGAHPEITVVVTAVEPTGERTADLRADLTVRGTTETLTLPATLERLGDDAVRVSTKTALDRTRFGVGGNPLGMLPTTTTLSADLVFTKADR
ncbi:YceI family protein [Mycobacterium sp. NBC_00419]|uniref:YceI family protein n=1 Tax=Mycobacterium sp. NBC_00419 TaxID=2975989 RepID=UPI002E204001